MNTPIGYVRTGRSSLSKRQVPPNKVRIKEEERVPKFIVEIESDPIAFQVGKSRLTVQVMHGGYKRLLTPPFLPSIKLLCTRDPHANSSETRSGPM